MKENEIIRKEGLSNGVVTYNGKRLCNFENGKSKVYYEELKK